jgi:hypothetical protein
MATIQELLDQAWDEKETTEAVMEIRTALQNLKNVAQQAEAKINRIVAGGSFATVHADLKAEGQACRTILTALVAALANHAEFIDFRPDQ